MAGTDRWLTYLNTLALFGMITALAFFNLDFPIPAFLQKHLKVVDKESPIGGSMPHNLADEYRKGCPNHQFTSIMHVSRSPPIMLIEGFLTEAEADFLVKLANPMFQDSLVVDYVSNASVAVDKQHRSSQTAYFDQPEIPPKSDGDVVLNCIEQRAARFQGYLPVDHLENLQVVKYTDSQEFRPHFDWFDPKQSDHLGPSGNRASSFFVYLVAKCFGGTTLFPEVPRPTGPEWCDALKCQEDDGQEVHALEVLPKVGRAIFWYHLDPETGDGDRRTLHAGMPVINGTKVGLNIFTRRWKYRNLV